MRKLQIIQNQPKSENGGKPLVNANTIGAEYGVTGRYILLLAAEGRIPCLRLGKKCVRFDPDLVRKALIG